MDTRKKELIIKLIQQDLKHNQLTRGLQKIGLNSDIYHLEIIQVVMELMQKNQDDNTFVKTYFHFMKQSLRYKVTHTGDNLKLLAEECYEELNKI